MRFQDRAVLVTGAGTGIGRATALAFAREGAGVFLAGRREEPLRATAAEIRAAGGRAEWRSTDVRDDAQVRAAVDAAVEIHGGLDVLVNNAGVVPEWTSVHETPDEAWDRALDVNLTGAFRAARAALPHLVRSRGAIVNVSTTSALKAAHAVASYAAAKAGLIALTRCLAAEYGWQGVRCNCIAPSWIETPMTEGFLADEQGRGEVAGRHALQRVGRPEEAAAAILYLAGDQASFVTGALLPVDGGMTAL